MKSIVDLIEENYFFHVFQPIRHITDRRIFGYEALCRSTSGATPLALFQEAVNQNRLYQLDVWSIEHALTRFFLTQNRVDEESLLFVNLFPSTVIAVEFPSFIQNLSGRFRSYAHRIVFEINEAIAEQKVWDNPLFIRRLGELRNAKFRIALDDVGEGSTTFRKIIEIAPDFIKLDRFFSIELSHYEKKQRVIQLFVNYCTDTDTDLILEGIERKEDCECASVLGVTIGQGYFLGKPEPLNKKKPLKENLEEFR